MDAADTFKRQIKSAKNWVVEFEDEKKKDLDDLWQFADHEAALATLGLMTSYMSKQIALPLEEAITILNTARKMKEKTELNEKQEDMMIAGLKEKNRKKLNGSWGLLTHYPNTFLTCAKAKSKRRDTDVYQVWSDVYKSMETRVKELGIDVYDQKKKLKVRMNPIDLYSIFFEFLHKLHRVTETIQKDRAQD